MSGALAGGLAGCGARPVPPRPSPTFLGTPYEDAFLGYRVVLPPGWRRSTHPRLTRQTPGSPPTANEIFTVRTVQDEEQQVACCLGDTSSPTLAYTVIVQVLENPRRLDAQQWPRSYYQGTQVTPVTVGGRPAVRAKDSPVGNGPAPGATGLWVGRDDQMFIVSPLYFVPAWLPPGWTEAKLAYDAQQIVDSFEFTR